MKTFFNDEMAAPNVLRVPIDRGITQQLGPIVRSKAARLMLYSKTPPWRSDIRWYSARSRRDFRRFRSVFDGLDVARHVAPYLDLASEVRLYNGFLVIRSSCTEPNFHVDWTDANNEGFTLMTPLTDNCRGFGMLYRKADGSVGEYDYKVGEALIFGERFRPLNQAGRFR